MPKASKLFYRLDILGLK